jgi:ssDNA-binding Zn-finger/Zn-ribbon topoisomerase 1
MAKNTLICPNCGSKNVRWRNRRWYDGPLNFLETMFTGATAIRTDEGISAMERSAMDSSFMRQRGIDEQRREMGRRTAELFWRCPDCRLKGEESKEDLI